MKTIVYVCPFVPAEWIAAHTMQPRRLLIRRSEGPPTAAPTRGVCPYAREFIMKALSETGFGAIVATTVCDQMRRAAEFIARDCDVPVFLMNVPSTWQTVTVQKLYIAELERLGQFLVRLGGRSPSKYELAAVMREYGTTRSSVRAARGRFSARRYSEGVASFNENGSARLSPAESESTPRGVAVALVGGPLMANDFQIFDFIEKAGGQVVLDATETGERTMPGPFDCRQLDDNPLVELANAYFGTIPDAFRRPNSGLYRWLRKEMAERGVRGIILRRYVWCDTWHAEVQPMRGWAEIPLLDLDIGDDDSPHRTASRIQSFLAVLT